MDENLLKLLELTGKDKMLFQLLRQCPHEILRNFKVRKYKDNRFVLKQGGIYNTFCVVASGYADIYVESGHDKRYLLCTYTEGNYTRELELFSQIDYIGRMEAKGDVTMLGLDRTCLARWIRMDNNFNKYMIQTLCSNSYWICANMGQNTLYALKQRICQYLVGSAGVGGKLRFVVSSEILSQKMVATQRNVNRVLKRPKEQGLIELNKGNIAIEDYDALNREGNQEEQYG